jgi:alkanesulfonate monooxygenase
MSLEVYWYLIPNDGPFPWHPDGQREVSYSYLRQMAAAVDHAGFTGALIATNAISHDAWILATSLMSHTERMKFIIAVHPGIVAPAMLAQKAATFDQFSKGRLAINIIAGDGHQLPPYGIYQDHDGRYEFAEEYWSVWRRLMVGETVSFSGKHLSLRDARLLLEPYQKPHPPLFLGGSSEPAIALAARHADTYLTWGEPPEQAGQKIARVRMLAAEHGRTLRYGVRLNLIVRETKKEAWDKAQWFLNRMDTGSIESRRIWTTMSDSIGQKRMNDLMANEPSKNARDLEISPDLWSGFGLIRNGPGTAIVGDPDTVAQRLQEYRDVGFDTFILSGHPLLEETFRVADLLFPVIGFPEGRSKGVKLSLMPSIKTEPQQMSDKR